MKSDRAGCSPRISIEPKTPTVGTDQGAKAGGPRGNMRQNGIPQDIGERLRQKDVIQKREDCRGVQRMRHGECFESQHSGGGADTTDEQLPDDDRQRRRIDRKTFTDDRSECPADTCRQRKKQSGRRPLRPSRAASRARSILRHPMPVRGDVGDPAGPEKENPGKHDSPDRHRERHDGGARGWPRQLRKRQENVERGNRQNARAASRSQCRRLTAEHSSRAPLRRPPG